MKEFIDKLISRLEEKKSEHLHDEKVMQELGKKNMAKFCAGKAWSIDGVIQIVTELAEEYINTSTEHINCSTDTSTKVSEMPTGWIPCERELPELTEGTEHFKQSKCCLVTLKWWDGDMTESVGWYNQSGVWNEDSKNCKVVAWLPLPAPYKEGE